MKTTDPFFRVQTLEQVHELMAGVERLAEEEAPLLGAAGRTLARDLPAPHDLPGFDRATMDGYAVRGADTFGASETSPAYLTLAGEVAMGQEPGFSLAPGQCAAIGTGGMLPPGADAVVMVEHSRRLDQNTVELSRAAAPGQNVLLADEDARCGEVLLPAARRLRPQDIGLLAALGLDRVPLVARPRVGIISTGDEVVPLEQAPAPGQVRDVNTYTLGCQLEQAGAKPVPLGLVPDAAAALKQAVAGSLEQNDLTLLSGGSSVGTRDLSVEVFLSFPDARILVHGVAVSPGKPFIWAQSRGRHLLGLPGQVASCLVAFHLFVEPMIERLLGRPAASFNRFPRQGARLARNLPSKPGVAEYIRVALCEGGDLPLAEPVFGKSGLIRTLTQGHGLLPLPLNSEGLEAGQVAEVLLFP